VRQEDFGHKIGDSALVTPLKVFGNIRSIEKSAHLLFCSAAGKTNFTGIQISLSITH